MNINIISGAMGCICIFVGITSAGDEGSIFFIVLGLFLLIMSFYITKKEKKGNFIDECKKSKIQDVSNVSALRAAAKRAGWKFASNHKLIETFNEMKTTTNAQKISEFLYKASKIDIENSDGEHRLYNIALSMGMIVTKEEVVELYLKHKEKQSKDKKTNELKEKRKAEESKMEPIFNIGAYRSGFTPEDNKSRRTMVLNKAVYCFERAFNNVLSNKPFEIQSESSWAIMGGIASGIAGSAAGVMAALDTQVRNAQIREKNMENAVLNAQYFTYIAAPKAKVLEDEKNRLSIKLDKSQAAFSEADYDNVLFENIEISTPEIFVFDNNNFVIFADFKSKNVCLKNGCLAYIDGILTAEVYENDNKILSVDAHLPLYNIKNGYNQYDFMKEEIEYEKIILVEKYPTKIIASGAFNRKVNTDNLKVKITNNKLYAIEKI